MTTKHAQPKNSKPKGGEKMIPLNVRFLPQDIKKAKQRAGIVALSKYVRTLVLMWIDGKIVITDEDVQEYN